MLTETFWLLLFLSLTLVAQYLIERNTESPEIKLLFTGRDLVLCLWTLRLAIGSSSLSLFWLVIAFGWGVVTLLHTYVWHLTRIRRGWNKKRTSSLGNQFLGNYPRTSIDRGAFYIALF